jgi:alkanesulfonate monooxygenase SsuD/methylene tetrahydromethanopterin reductase-like flavin-dependent oxidoreductase (luciferase family)
LLSLEPPEERQLVLYREIMAERGLPAAARGFSWTRHVCLGRTPQEADDIVDDLLPRLHARRVRFAARRGQTPDQVPSQPRQQFLREQAISGDPDACIQQLAAMARQGVTHLRLVFNGTGVYDNRTVLRRMELFAREVLPACREL